jgi:hypothetical protein
MSVTLGELRSLIAEIPEEFDNAIVIVQKDAEGNDYSPLSGIDNNAIYEAECSWSGDVFSLDWSADDCCLDEDQWEEMKETLPRCIVLFPVN